MIVLPVTRMPPSMTFRSSALNASFEPSVPMMLPFAPWKNTLANPLTMGAVPAGFVPM
jgi:hypothetical protein